MAGDITNLVRGRTVLFIGPPVVEELANFGYPAYLLDILGTWKLLGAYVVLSQGLPAAEDRRLTIAAGTVVVTVAHPRANESDGSGQGYEIAALEWSADHARELGAHPGRLMIAGHAVGGARAARLALAARDNRWPVLSRQLLVHPRCTPDSLERVRCRRGSPASSPQRSSRQAIPRTTGADTPPG